MAEYIRRMSAAAVLSVALLAGACSGDGARTGDTTLTQDSALSRDLLLAGADTSVQPQLQDMPADNPVPPGATTTPPARTTTPARPRTTTTTPRPSTGTSTSTARTGSIAAGTTLSLASDARVCTNTHKAGSTFTATVAEGVTGSNGVRIPAGAKVSITVTKADRSENVNDPIVFEFAVNSVSFGGSTYPLTATIASAKVDRVANQPGSKDAQKVAVGAAAGAIAGRVLGGNTKGAVIGGAIGALGGAAAAKATANYEGCVPENGAIAITLDQSVSVKA